MPVDSDRKGFKEITMSTYYNTEPYKSSKCGFFATIPIPNTGEALILSGGIGPDLLVSPNMDPSLIRKGKYTKLVRIDTGLQHISGTAACYCKSQTYQFHIRYSCTCHVHKPLEVWANHCPDMNPLAEEYYQNLFSMMATSYEMQDLSSFQAQLSEKMLTAVNDVSGLRIGPLKSVQVEMDAEYRAHLRSMQKDTEKTELETHRIKNAGQLQQSPITAKVALLRDVLDGKRTLDEVLQVNKDRNLEDIARLKTLLEQLNEMRSSGVIDEENYQRMMEHQFTQIAPTLPFKQLGSAGGLAPDAEDL